ncbi:hypothetical protein M8J76_006559 [Diaphorina citri]|nr:hypothetical protein M8J75_001254 [Diaphorina citri]KAI5740738.1 hypothetical protein M8J76_006559 [Diaphorina citri]KAI5748374.1 hypothetical protein M8J77_024858 [Diaphorina citri]
MENKKKQEGELEVTGVSRSGRVRKKSSKLVDFESSDDVVQEKRPYTKKADGGNVPGTPARRGRPPSQHSPLKHGNAQHGNILPPEYQHQNLVESPQDPSMPMAGQHIMLKEEVNISDISDSELYNSAQAVGSGADEEFGEADSSLDAESIGSGDLADNLLIDEDDLSQESIEAPQFMVDGKPLPKKRGPKPGRRKNQRKDKGKARFTAYMLWAKQIRQKLIKSNPDMDFSQVSKKLGELWHTVPFNEKYGWKRQADRLAAKYTQKMSKAPAQKTKSTYTPHGRVGRPPLNKQTVEAVIETKPSPPAAPRVPLVKPTLPADLFKVTGTQPLDIAAHLRLLGDNLTIIGERLKDTQGRMAISGGMSLLLDSFLCALGPLLCLTQQIPEENGCSPETLSHVLDNIAYIMPGL